MICNEKMAKTKEAYWKGQFNKVNHELSVLTFALVKASKALADYQPEKWCGMDEGMIYSKLMGDTRKKYTELEISTDSKNKRGDMYGYEA